MTISTLANLENQVESFLHRANILDVVGADNVDNLIELGELWIFRRARTHEMEATLSSQMSADGTLTVPSDYLALKHARISGTPTRYLKMRPSSWVLEHYPARSATGKPSFIARDGGSFIFGVFPDSQYTVNGTYYAKPTTIISSANSLFVANPDLYLYSALVVAEQYVKNHPMAQAWQMQRDAILMDVNGNTEEGQHGTGMAIAADALTI